MKISTLTIMAVLLFVTIRSNAAPFAGAEDLESLRSKNKDLKKSEDEPSNEALLKGSYPGGKLTELVDVGIEDKVHRSIIAFPSEGLKLRAVLTAPTSAMPKEGYPVVIFNHGYVKEPKQYKALGPAYAAYERYYAQQGFLVVRPDYRGHGDSEGEAYANGYAPGYIIDTLNLVASLKKDARANPKRIYMVGHSIGGLVSLQSAELSSDIKAVVDYAGSPCDPKLRHSVRPKASAEFPSFDFQFEQIRSHVDQLRVPVQIHNGTADTHLPIAFAENFYELLCDSGKKDVEFFSYADAGHMFQGADLELFLERTVDLFNSKPRAKAPQGRIVETPPMMPNPMPGPRIGPMPGMGAPLPFGPRYARFPRFPMPRPAYPLPPYPLPPYPYPYRLPPG